MFDDVGFDPERPRRRKPRDPEAAERKRVNKKAKKGIQMMLGRQAAIQGFTFVGGVILARVLTPAEFGLFGITTFVINMLSVFGDFGLTPSFIQRKDELSQREIQVGFTVQLVVVSFLAAIVWVAAPYIAGAYPSLDAEQREMLMWLVRTLAFALFLMSFRSMNALQLERKLDYKLVALAETVSVLGYQTVAVTMAVMGFSTWSLVAAVLVKQVSAGLIMYLAAPWKVRLAWDWAIAKEALRFGIPFQGQRLLQRFKMWLTPTLVAGMIGPAAVGFLTWSSANGRKPLVIVSNLMRVSFAQFSRLQDDKEAIKRTLLRYFDYLIPLGAAWFMLLVVAGYPLTALIYTEKWVPAVPALALYAFILILNMYGWVVGVALQSTGGVGFSMRKQLSQTVIHIALMIPLLLVLDRQQVTIQGQNVAFLAVPIAELISVLLTTKVLFDWIDKGLFQQALRGTAWVLIPCVIAGLVGGSVYVVDHYLLRVPLFFEALTTAGLTGLSYALAAWFVAPQALRQRWAGFGVKMLGRTRLNRFPGFKQLDKVFRRHVKEKKQQDGLPIDGKGTPGTAKIAETPGGDGEAVAASPRPSSYPND